MLSMVVFPQLVFNTSGGMGPIATTVYKRIASTISEKYDCRYSNTIRWIRLNFSLLRSTIMCLRGSQSSPVTVLYLLTQTLTLPFMRGGSLFKYSYTFTVLLVIFIDHTQYCKNIICIFKCTHVQYLLIQCT